jgi:hypothetical protein
MVTEARETGSLIGSDKVEGTAVYGADDAKIGSIERVMIDKMSGKVSYAVLSFGGFLWIGDDHYPLPWQSLKYDTNLGGYRTGITETQKERRNTVTTTPGTGAILREHGRSMITTALQYKTERPAVRRAFLTDLEGRTNFSVVHSQKVA